MPDRITIEVSRDGLTGGIQVSINKLDDHDIGHGYRILGPKFSGTGEVLATATLTERDVTEIGDYLAPLKEAGDA